ncbi:MAG: DUF6572 domain-containing protein [Chthoniobacterales bacterium]
MKHHHHSPAASGLENTASLDAFAHDTQNDILILAMFETRPWDLGDLQLFQLQEKLNAYVSFILDGEMIETFPDLKDKPVRIELRTLHNPSEQALDFLARVKEQLSHQNINVEVVLIEENFEGCCGGHQTSCCGGEEKTSCCSDDESCCCGDESCCCDDESCCCDDESCCCDDECCNDQEGSCCKESEPDAPASKKTTGCGCS